MTKNMYDIRDKVMRVGNYVVAPSNHSRTEPLRLYSVEKMNPEVGVVNLHTIEARPRTTIVYPIECMIIPASYVTMLIMRPPKTSWESTTEDALGNPLELTDELFMWKYRDSRMISVELIRFERDSVTVIDKFYNIHYRVSLKSVVKAL